MNHQHYHYENPLVSRYGSADMSRLWSAQKRISIWRRLWLALAQSQQALGLDISDQQLSALAEHLDDIDFDAAREHEQRLRHDVMAHLMTYADACPVARPIIHLGATSCFVTDNTDLILIREAMRLVARRLVQVIDSLSQFAMRHRRLSCLGLTHLQPAQPTTVGRRACLWLNDLVDDLDTLQYRQARLRARGVKGTTGTQASFLRLFEGDHEKVAALDAMVTQKMGFEQSYQITGQTYSRKVDSQILDALSGIAQSAHKIATDIRLLAARKEVEEPFESQQIGSSAMPYKRNPMRSERICSLARFVISLQSNPAYTLATQWIERSLDDSANRRIVLPQAFLGVDAILILLANVFTGLVVYPRVIENNLRQELPFMAVENILMAAVAAGGDRQALHEKMRQHSQAAADRVKLEGLENDLLQRLKQDQAFAHLEFDSLLDAQTLIGRAPQQVEQFIEGSVQPVLERFRTDEASPVEVRV